MATWYVNSAAAGTGAGTSWVNACTTMAAAITLSAAGDDFNVANTHAETQASALTLTFKGTAASPNRVFSCDTTNAPAQASDLLAGASISTTGANSITIAGTFYCYGVTFNAGSAANSASITLQNPQCELEACSLVLNNTSASSVITLGVGSSMYCRLVGTTMTFGAVGQQVKLGRGMVEWYNTASAIKGTVPTSLFATGTNVETNILRLIGVDLSALGAGKTIFSPTNDPVTWSLIDCKLGASVTTSSTPTGLNEGKIDLINSDSSATGYRCERYQYQGTLTTETTIIRSGGSPQSWKIVTTANDKRTVPFECFETLVYAVAGTPLTVNLNCITDLNTDATALTNADIWMEAQVPDNVGFPISSLYTTAPATQLTAGSTLTSGTTSGSWTTTGMTTPDARNATLTFTPQISGYVRVTVKVARASLSTLRVDFKLT